MKRRRGEGEKRGKRRGGRRKHDKDCEAEILLNN